MWGLQQDHAVVGHLRANPRNVLGTIDGATEDRIGDGPADRVLYANVAPRQDEDEPREDNAGERLVAARLGSLAANVLVGDDGNRVLVDPVHPGLEQQRRLDDSGARRVGSPRASNGSPRPGSSTGTSGCEGLTSLSR